MCLEFERPYTISQHIVIPLFLVEHVDNLLLCYGIKGHRRGKVILFALF